WGGAGGVKFVQMAARGAEMVRRAPAETIDHLTAISPHGAVEFGEMSGDEIAQRGGVASDAFRQLRAAVVEHVLERLQPRREKFAHRVAAARDRVGERGPALIEHVLERR